MKSLMKVLPIATLILISGLSLAAQNTLPDPHNDSCWSSIGALQNCQIQAYDQAQDYSQRCTSYPEYQCIPEYISLQKEPAAKRVSDHLAASSRTPNPASNVNSTQAVAQPGN